MIGNRETDTTGIKTLVGQLTFEAITRIPQSVEYYHSTQWFNERLRLERQLLELQCTERNLHELRHRQDVCR